MTVLIDKIPGISCLINKSYSFSTECASENCILQCPFNEQEQPCVCKDGTKIYSSELKHFVCLILNCC